MRARDFTIAYAWDNEYGELVRPWEAEHHAPQGRYRCLDPNCSKDLVVVNRGRTRYFRHRPGDAQSACGFSRKAGDQRQHTAARELLVAVLRNALRHRAPLPALVVERGGERSTHQLVLNVENVVPEWHCPVTGRRPDIALLDQYGKPVMLIEIHHTNRVQGERRRDYQIHRWVEVSARAVMEDPESITVEHQGGVLAARYDPDQIQRHLPGMPRNAW